MAKIAFIGMGVMGGPMARHLAANGHDLVVHNRSREKAQAWVAAHGGRAADRPVQAVKDADVVITCVGRDDDLRQLMFGPNGCFAAMKRGALFIDHTTISAELARELAEQAGLYGLLAVDAPVSGGQAGAENGTLAAMCGGTEAAMAAAEPIMSAYSARIVHIGPAGAGQACKMANQICIAGVLQGLSEALRFSQASGLDTDKVYEAISGGAAQSWQMDNRWATMAKDEFDFGFAIDWMRKDLGLTLDEARRLGATLPVTALVDQFYADVQKMGGSRQDTSALVRRLPE